MNRFFIIGIDPITKEHFLAIEAWVKEKDVGWWHWIDGMWLIVSSDPTLSVTSIRDQLKEVANGVTNLVVEIDPITWSGFGPESEQRNMFTWLHKYWNK